MHLRPRLYIAAVCNASSEKTESNPIAFATTSSSACATVYHSLYATVAYPDMQRWHKVNDTPSQNCIPGSCGDASGLGTGG